MPFPPRGVLLVLCAAAATLGGTAPASAQSIYGAEAKEPRCQSLSGCANADSLDPGAGGGHGAAGGSGNGGSGQGGNGSGADNGGGSGGGGLGDTSGQIDLDDEQIGGTANPLSMKNPLCGDLSSGEAAINCKYGQGPETPYPTANYGLDIYADDTGSAGDAIVGNFQKMLAAIANAIWMVMVMALKGVFTFVGWAFDLVPFSNDRASSRVDSGLENFYANFTSPWLVFAFVILGAWALYRGVLKRELSQTAGGLLLSVCLMGLALWILHEPRDSIGEASAIVDQAALGVIAAPQDGSLADPQASYGKATERAWQIMTTAPYAALQFSDTSWALAKPDPELKEYMWDDVERYCSDAAFGGSRTACEGYRAAIKTPTSNLELILASSPGSQNRSDEMWNHFDEHVVQEKMAMQGGAGAWLRLPLVLLFAIGLLGALCLFMWIAIRLFVQTAIAFVLVLSAPIALFFPAFGEKGRAAFARWGATLLGAIVAKLVYAALLSIVLFGTSVLFGMVSSSDRGVTVTMGFLLAAGFWWAIFLKRQQIAGLFSLSDRGEGGAGSSRVGAALGLYGAARLGDQLWNGARGRLPAGRRSAAAPFGGAGGGERGEEPRTTSEEQASAQLDQRAGERLEAERSGAERTIAGGAARQEEAARLRGEADRESERAKRSDGGHGRERALRNADRLRRKAAGLEREGRRQAPAERRAAKLAERAHEGEARSGQPFSPAEVAESREALRNNLNKPVGAGVHGHYVGKSAREYEALSGRERELAQRQVAARISEDQAAFGVIPDSPGGAVAPRARASAYRKARRDALGDEAFRAERAAAKRLQKARKAYRHRRRRSGVSR